MNYLSAIGLYVKFVFSLMKYCYCLFTYLLLLYEGVKSSTYANEAFSLMKHWYCFFSYFLLLYESVKSFTYADEANGLYRRSPRLIPQH